MNVILSPITLTFIVAFLGVLLGKIRIRGISLGISGVFVIAVLVGYVISQANTILASTEIDYGSTFKTLSNMGISLFVPAIGISTGYAIQKNRNIQYIKAIILGASMVIMAGFIVFTISKFDAEANTSILVGVLCGALTTTPGLSSVNEIAGVDSALSSAGYGCAYLFGVISIIMYVQCCSKTTGNHDITERKAIENRGSLGLLPLSVAVVIGRTLGELKLPYASIPIGISSSLLLAGVLVGYISAKNPGIQKTDNQILTFIKHFGLILFFVGNGIPAGMKLSFVFDFRYFAYGISISVFTILFGHMLCKVLRISSGERYAFIAGGMTSTPAFVLASKGIENASANSIYATAYMSSTLIMTIGVKILYFIMTQ